MTVDNENMKFHSNGNCIIETSPKGLIAGCSASEIPADGSVTQIYNSAFYGCSNLTSIHIPDSVAYIYSNAFNGCTNLTRITYGGTMEQWNAISKVYSWNSNCPATEVVCTDGTVTLEAST